LVTTALTCTGTALALAAGGRLLAVTVALLAPDPQRRADAREVLRLLLTHHRHMRGPDRR
jgi:hypothetical protein